MFQTVKEGIAGILKGLELQESEQAFDFKNASENEYENAFILRCLSGEMQKEDLNVGFTDAQVWEIDVAFPKTSQSDLVNTDEIHRLKDSILSAVDNPDVWRTFVRMMKYKSWKLTNNPSHVLLTITVNVIDTYTY